MKQQPLPKKLAGISETVGKQGINLKKKKKKRKWNKAQKNEEWKA